ncbi:MAG TPA: electron transport complex subunit RsxE [Kiritimatiellia bacterium]|jgi:Na+-transporting NADH:ubiquinone oxidoreductase subunit D|nr:MAG: Na(+)-translocating NADH-quinone reductase subunit D [Verrucomicrobia bacterium ADurb.Bin018]HOD99953.1 electron transport complex subunit RsxE [Kiritimatiellia bacterium]HOE36551.1 electron transport complex subunit RsxE [Kiritimatiellia bacterium]HOR74672.1 electron transport complex subunit RsxE [Kiritimatiellia bacterium]HOU59182.1 electron transport complex subunit RsxE [Kiritimatiellia bacterium]
MASSYGKILKDGLVTENPIFRQVLGICSALAVTNLVTNTLYMGFGVTFTTALTSFTIALLRNYIPVRIRMIVQVIIIAVYVMVVEILIKALAPDVHRFIGPYVGLIITNCIIMGRAEAFASQNKPLPSLVDGLANGLGYTSVLVAIAVIREIMSFGTVLGYKLPALDLWWHPWTIMVMPPGAFFMLAILTWMARARLVKEVK